MGDDWPQIKARLEVAAGTSSGHFDPKLPVYIRVALQRDDEARDIIMAEAAGRRAAEAEVERLTREVKRLERLILDWQTGLDYSSGQPWVAIDAAARRIRDKREERCPYCANPIGDGSGGTCTAECHSKGDSCRCNQREDGE